MASRRKFGFCTLCLGKERNLQNAFEHSEIGFKPQMVIEDLLHVQVCNRGHFPWMICGRCMQKLNAFRNFKCDAMKSLKVLKILLLDHDSEDDLQMPTNSEFDDAGEQNSSKENDSEVLKQEEDEVTEFHRNDSEVGDGCSEGDTCIGVSCDEDEDDELHLYLESDSESEVGGQGEEDESSPCQVSSPQSGSTNVSGGNSNLEVAEIREEEERHKTVEDKSLDVPRRTWRSARLQAVKGCDGGNSEEKQGSTNGEEKNDLMMQAGADGKNTRRKKTKGMETKSVSPRSSVAEQRMERRREMKREWRRKYVQSMSEEKRREYNRKHSEAAKRRVANMTEEQRKEYRKRRTESCRMRRSQMSEEEKIQYNRRNAEKGRRCWARKSEEKREEYRRRMKERNRKYRSQ